MTGMFALLLSALGLVGCPSPPGPVTYPLGPVTQVAPPLEPARTAVQEALDRGDLPGAAAALEVLASQLDAGDDADAALLSLYRARMARLEGNEAGALDGLRAAAGPGAAPEVAAAALVYLALSEAEKTGSDAALEGLESLPGNPQAYLGAVARGPGWTLVAEARNRADDPEGSLDAFALAFDGAESVGDQALSRFVVARAFAVASTLAPDSRAVVFAGAQGLARAAAGYEMVRAQAADPTSAGFDAVLPPVLAALAEVGQVERVVELEHIGRPSGAGEARLVGAVLPLTGPSRRVGRRTMAGILQALGAFFPGGGQRLTVVFKDSGSSPEAAQRAVEELDAAGVSAILGPLGVDETLAAARVARERGIPLVSFAVDDAVLTEGALRFGLDARAEAALAADELLARGLSRALIVRPEMPFGEALAQAFAESFVTGGGTVVETYTYEAKTVDHRKMAERAAELDFDVVFVPDTGEAAALVARFMAQQNIWSASPERTLMAAAQAAQGSKKKGEARRFVTYAGPGSWYAPELHAQSGGYLEGALFVASYMPDAKSKANTFFVDTFVHLYGREPGIYEAVAFDATRLVRDLIMSQGLYDRAALAAALAGTTERVGVTGSFGFVDGVARPATTAMQIGADEVHPLAALPMLDVGTREEQGTEPIDVAPAEAAPTDGGPSPDVAP